jgi:site-specific DNA-methyltransferase (adenine-specific)
VTPYWQSKDGRITIHHGDFRELEFEEGQFDMVLTDPPYGTQWVSKTGGQRTEITNDYDNLPMIIESIHRSKIYTKPGSAILYFCTGSRPDLMVLWLNKFPYNPPPELLIWEKPGLGMGPRYRRCYETIIVGTSPGEKQRWYGGHSQGNIIKHPRVAPKKDGGHPSPKPVSLVEKLMGNHTTIDDVVWDPFMGEGTTLVAASRLHRKAVGIEIEERWCERAVKRLESDEARPYDGVVVKLGQVGFPEDYYYATSSQA